MKTKFLSKLVPLSLILCLLVSLVAVFGCTPEPTPAPTPEPTPSPTPTPAEPAIKRGGTLKIIVDRSANALGYGPSLIETLDILVASPCVETLVHFDENSAMVPWLATDVKSDAKAKTITLTLRKGVKFHDGTDFNAAAVKWNIEQMMAAQKGEVRFINTVDVVDDYTVRINMSDYDNGLVYNLATFPGFMTSPAAYKEHGEEWCNTHPVGTGPFKFVSFERDVSLKYERFDGYWQEGKPYLDGVEFVYITDPMVRLAAFQAGDADVIIQILPRETETLKASGDYVFSTCPGYCIGFAGDSAHTDSPFADIRVRQAFAHAIDGEPLVETMGLGYWVVADQLCAPHTPGYNPAPSVYEYNPQKSRELLAEAGYPDGLECPLFTPQDLVDFNTMLQDQLDEAGFKVTIDLVNPAREGEMVMGSGWHNGIFPVQITLVDDYSRAISSAFTTKGVPFRSILRPPEVDEVIFEASSTDDMEIKAKKNQEAEALIRDKYCTVTVICDTQYIAARHQYVHDDGFYSVNQRQQTLEDTWIDK
jgi:peptide/nickel transport system substrate-binding protein